MELILDNQPLEVTEGPDALVTAVIQRVSAELQTRNRVICEIFVDGHPIGGFEDPRVAARVIQDCGHLRLISEEPRKLANKVFYEIAEYMPKLRNALVETSVRIQSRKEKEGLDLLENLTSTWAELYHGLQSAITVTGIDCDSISVEGKSFIQINNEIQQFLEEITELVQDQRLLELSDILEYEIAPRIPLIEECIYRIIRKVEKPLH